MTKLILSTIFAFFAFTLSAQIGNEINIKLNNGMMPINMAPTQPIVQKQQAITQEIKHDAPDIDPKFSLSDGRKEVEASEDSEYDTAYSIDIVPTEEDLDGTTKKFYGTIEVVSVSVVNNETRVVIAPPSMTAEWFLISKLTYILDKKSGKQYVVTNILNGLDLPKSIAYNLTKNRAQNITITFPALAESVDIIDIVFPMPNIHDRNYLMAQ